MKNGVCNADLFTWRVCCSFAIALVLGLTNKANCSSSISVVKTLDGTTVTASPTPSTNASQTATFTLNSSSVATLLTPYTSPTQTATVTLNSSSVATLSTPTSPTQTATVTLNSSSVATLSTPTSPTTSISITTTNKPVTTTPPAATQIWDKVISGWLGDKISFIVVVSAVALCLILLLALIITCCRYHKLKKKTKFPKDLIINNDSAWINSNDDLLMWERNLRATEVNAAPPTAPANDKRQ